MYRLKRVNAANRNGLGRFYFVLGLYTYLMLTITCSSPTAYETLQGQAQGSTYTLQFERSKTIETKLLQKEIDQLLSNIDQSMSTYVPGSIISKLNQSEGAYVKVDTLFMRVLVSALGVANDTEGVFDPTIGSVVQLWGFGFDEMRGDISEKSIQEALSRSGFEQINVDTLEASVRIPNGFSIDFNAIAQGFSVDTLALLLESKGIQNYMVELGGEVRTRGYNAQGDYWNIGIDRPINESETGRELQAIISLKNQSLATSGNYRKFWVDEQTGIKYAHTINPKTGRPAMNQLLSASIVHAEATMADAYATACMVWGHLKCVEFLESNADYSGVLVYTDVEGNWFTYYSPELNISMVKTD
jgi:FAD:protein FMN transferase